MAALIIQTGIRHGRVAEVVKSSSDSLTIGRGFDNDLVLVDPYIAANQLCFKQREGEWFVDIIDETNPVLINGQNIVDNTQVQSGDRLRVGRTSLTIYLDNHQIEPTRKLLLSGWLHHDNLGIILPTLVLLGVCLLDAGIGFLQVSDRYEWKEYTFYSLIGALIIVIWAAIWSIAGRLLRHEHHFSSQLLITSVAAGVYTLLEPISSYIEYATNSIFTGEATAIFFVLVVLTGLLKFNLMFATNIVRSSTAALVASISTTIFLHTINYLEQTDQSNRPEYSNVLKAPFAHISGDSSIDEYFQELEGEFERLEIE
ncbi:FHA domain-containing protein [Spartinivicinus poritis]|uniref:FHA domain-containing protein n=1 Tax=Spartinivicinus poritis TaxID=2994640 RepID=A0ABT5UBM9_9GAMM|nr:FHA domain-containing protein [Spartinivicinus sp. A2-2]MDE1463780.1 FHA domain-containing protein [Spartinivicinus sp. A2-2]